MHPSETQIEAYARRTLDPAELLDVDDHLAGCGECRSRAAARAGVDAGVAEVSRALRQPEAEAGFRRWVWPSLAAAALVLALVPVALRWRSPALPGLAALPPEQQQRVKAALTAGVVEPPAELAELAGRTEALMGPTSETSFRPIQPLATVTVSDRPALRWSPLAGAQSYTVAVADESLQPLAQSPVLTGTSWTPAQPLPRGRVYLWQVTAHRGADSFTTPAPPAPFAKFRVMEGDMAALLERLGREHPAAHVVLGVLYAQAGARTEALAHLGRIDAGDRHHDLAQRTIERLRGLGSAATGPLAHR
jgi:hypothetical protein